MARGRYLVETLGCFDCHGEHDWTKHDAPLIEGTRPAGYADFPMAGLPGRIVPPNITPDPETGAGNVLQALWLQPRGRKPEFSGHEAETSHSPL